MAAPRSPGLPGRLRAFWMQVGRVHPSLRRTFLGVVLPLSLLPPLMLLYAGTHHGDQFLPGQAGRNWLAAAGILLGAELATVAAMGPVIRWIAWLNGVAADRTSAYLLAFAAPIPLWLSSLVLLVPNRLLDAGVGLLAFGASCLAIHHGVSVLLRVRETVVAAAIAYGIMACGLLAWGLLLVSVMAV